MFVQQNLRAHRISRQEASAGEEDRYWKRSGNDFGNDMKKEYRTREIDRMVTDDLRNRFLSWVGAEGLQVRNTIPLNIRRICGPDAR
ncbi:hypothetical protein AVEN_13406-1 [Araneus ventricosus]|uniref:Uncharacterized protein n=1 Tax=Araneus ventricosus TaxID=182803 RepID=A0A4Y2UXR3_ARAVE|nr:hypothetical protein AVEN_191787-1 [Araneus ventricosus]GBO16851.1 hypothetical protein AVEN_213708-1 [Araneus ventricosus]GBO16871.1 hypothetical protein AVEN_27551-1 [Araneus ventricosus]GBO16934.1 hypothetical protein AVEN_13406-1 [Araneus ventricosus]